MRIVDWNPSRLNNLAFSLRRIHFLVLSVQRERERTPRDRSMHIAGRYYEGNPSRQLSVHFSSFFSSHFLVLSSSFHSTYNSVLSEESFFNSIMYICVRDGAYSRSDFSCYSAWRFTWQTRRTTVLCNRWASFLLNHRRVPIVSQSLALLRSFVFCYNLLIWMNHHCLMNC